MALLEPVADIRSLDLLHSVDECGSIAQAAKRHNMSQPAASMRLRSLEDTLGLRLLDRSHGRASMTVAEYLVPGWLSRLQTVDPEMVVSLAMGNSRHVVDVMLSGEAGIGFVEGRHAPRELSSRGVQSDVLVVVVAPDHSWARRRKPLSPVEFSLSALALREAGSGTREVLDAAMAVLGLKVRPLIELGSTTAIKAAVASGIAPGVLSRLAVADDIREGRLVVVETRDISLVREIRAVWSRDRPLAAPAKLLLRQLG